MKTEAAVLVEPGRWLEMMELEIPNLREGQVLVAISYSGLCGSQLLEISGSRGPDRWLPHALGHEAVGTVIDVDPSVTRVKIGQTVILSWIAASTGMSAGGTIYMAGARQVHAGPVTTLMRHAVVSEDRCTALHPSMPRDLGVLLGCAWPTGAGSVRNVALVGPNDIVGVIGCGAVGLCAVMAANMVGARVYAVDPQIQRSVITEAMGATRVERLPLEGFDAVIVATGVPEVVNEALIAVKPRGGRVVLIGNSSYGTRTQIDPHELNMGKSLLGTWGGDTNPDRNFVGDLLAMQTEARLITSLHPPYALADINQAVADMVAGDVVRPLIDMSL